MKKEQSGQKSVTILVLTTAIMVIGVAVMIALSTFARVSSAKKNIGNADTSQSQIAPTNTPTPQSGGIEVAGEPTGMQCGVSKNLAKNTPNKVANPNVNDGKVDTKVVIADLPGNPSSIAFHPDGTLYVSLDYSKAYPRPYFTALYGTVIAVVNGKAQVLLDGLHDPSALLFVGDNLYISQLGQILVAEGVKGNTCKDVKVVIDGLPFDNIHKTNGMTFHNGRIFISQGHSLNGANGLSYDNLLGTVFSIKPDGSDLQVYATGLRNMDDLVFDDKGNLWGADNGPNVGYDSGFTSEDQITPDTILAIKQGDNFGYPCAPGLTCGKKPTALLPKHSAPTGVVWYKGRLLIGLWSLGQVVSYNPQTQTIDPLFYNIGLPTAMTIGPDGRLYVAEWIYNRILSLKLPN